jgi:hypothetical protein
LQRLNIKVEIVFFFVRIFFSVAKKQDLIWNGICKMAQDKHQNCGKGRETIALVWKARHHRLQAT